MICDYGCGQEAKHQLKNGKYCCSKNHSLCPNIIKKIKEKTNDGSKLKQEYKEFSFINKLRLCDYGCGQIAKFKNINDKYCCSKFPSQCPKLRMVNSIKNKGLNKKKKKGVNKLIGRKNPRFMTIDKIKEKYKLFSKIEEMRYNPQNLDEIQVHCKNHNCPNSKEKGGWFTPTKIKFYERLRQIESLHGQGGCYFYCSDECKNSCSLSYVRDDPFKEINNKQNYTQQEYHIFRQTVLEIDNYICQYCGKLAEHVHHERPQKLEPFFSLDPDLAWSVCKECHYKYGHKDDCNTNNLAKKEC